MLEWHVRRRGWPSIVVVPCGGQMHNSVVTFDGIQLVRWEASRLAAAWFPRLGPAHLASRKLAMMMPAGRGRCWACAYLLAGVFPCGEWKTRMKSRVVDCGFCWDQKLIWRFRRSGSIAIILFRDWGVKGMRSGHFKNHISGISLTRGLLSLMLASV